jgi:hypothetical protein
MTAKQGFCGMVGEAKVYPEMLWRWYPMVSCAKAIRHERKRDEAGIDCHVRER